MTEGSAAFLASLTVPSGLSVVVMLGVAAGLLLAFVVFVQWAAQTGRSDLFATDMADHPAFLVADLTRLSDHPDDPPVLAIIGASVTRASFGTTAEIAEAFRERTGQVVEVVNLCSGRQPIPFHLALVENLPRNRPVTVVLGIGPSRFTFDRSSLQDLYDGDYLPISGPEENALMHEVGIDPGSASGIAVMEDGVFYAGRATSLAKNLAGILLQGHSVKQHEELYIGRPKVSDATFRNHSEVVAARFENAEENIAMNRQLLAQLVDLVKSRPNLRLVLYEDPMNPDFIANYLGAERYDEYLAYMRGFAESKDLPYWTFSRDLGLGREAFYDWAHISSNDAQVALRAGLIDHLAEMEH
jgi:hypothetical protein